MSVFNIYNTVYMYVAVYVLCVHTIHAYVQYVCMHVSCTNAYKYGIVITNIVCCYAVLGHSWTQCRRSGLPSSCCQWFMSVTVERCSHHCGCIQDACSSQYNIVLSVYTKVLCCSFTKSGVHKRCKAPDKINMVVKSFCICFRMLGETVKLWCMHKMYWFLNKVSQVLNLSAAYPVKII